MKTLKLSIVIMLISLNCYSQSFSEVFYINDTLDDGSVEIYPYEYAIFVNKKDTVSLIPILRLYPKEDEHAGMQIHGLWFYSKSSPDSFIVNFKKKPIVFHRAKFADVDEEIYKSCYTANDAGAKDLISIMEGITFNSISYEPIYNSRPFLIKLLGGFEKINAWWYD